MFPNAVHGNNICPQLPATFLFEKVWKRIGKIRESHTSALSPHMQYMGEIVMDQQKIADIMADHYFFSQQQ